jgi:hypothetical protein
VLAVSGAASAVVLARILHLAVSTIRAGQVVRGEIHSLRPDPRWGRGYSGAEAWLADGRSLPVAVPAAAAASILRRGGRAEVLLLAAPGQTYGFVIALSSPKPATSGHA